jgi:iron complex outermembrane receptor protein
MFTKFGRSAWQAGVSAALLGAATTTFAADGPVAPGEATVPEQILQTVIVTGSHIKRAADAEAAENVQVVSAQEIKNSGQQTVADYLRTISSTFGNSQNEAVSNSFAPGAAMVGLRGLTGADTLVLLNGRRITNYGLFQNLSDAFVDLNVIPLAAIERIEILKSGGSAIYGSDAVAGVINIILKENTTEKAVEFGGALTTEGGAAQRDGSVSAGFGDFPSQGYNIFVTASIFKRDQLLASQRDNTKNQDWTGLPDGANEWHIANQYQGAGPGGLGMAFPTCGTNGLPGRVQPNGLLTYGPGCYFNQASELALMPGTQRINLTATGNLRLSDAWTGYSDLFFSNEETRSDYTPATLDQASFVVNPVTGGANSVSNVLPGTSPYALNGQPTPIVYGFQSVGPRNEEVVSNTWRATFGAKGTWAGWDIDSGYGHSENHVQVNEVNAINAANLVTEIANGSFDFLDPSQTPAANNALRITDTFGSVAKLDTLDVKGSGTLFDLPGGPMKAAFGAEARYQSVDDKPGTAAAEGLIFNTGSTRVVGSREIYSAFGEFDFPFLPSLDVDFALREEHYSDVGNNLRPQVTLRWQPVHELTMRAVYADGFRAPSLAEASNSFSVSHDTVNNPVTGNNINIGVVTGGNPLVKPETSKNADLGVVFSPTSNFDVSLDYYNIWLYKVIAPSGAPQTIINDPSAYPGQIVYGAGGQVLYVEALYTNQYEVHTAGVDFNAALSIPLADGKLKFALNGTSISTFGVKSGPGQWDSFLGNSGWDYASPISGGGPVTRLKGSLSAGWEDHDWAGLVAVRYVSSYENATTIIFGATTQVNVEPFTAVDLNAEYRGIENWKFSLSVVNAFNRQPPYDSSALLFLGLNQAWDSTLYDDMGRTIDLHVTYKF